MGESLGSTCLMQVLCGSATGHSIGTYHVLSMLLFVACAASA